MTPERQADADRLARARAGDEAALAELYERHVDALWSFVFYRVGRDPALCEDVVQDTFLLAFERGESFDPARGSFTAWLFGLSRNLIRKQLRSRDRAHELAATWERIDATLVQLFQGLEREPLGDEVLVREETRDLVQMTIANLPDDYRDALERKYVRGQSLHELAAAFACSEAAAKSMLARARRAFRDAFATLAQAFAEPGEHNGEVRDVRA